jgi:hypothetical protein
MDVLDIAGALNKSGHSFGLDRDDFHREIEKRAEASKLPHESAAQSYTRILGTPEGRELYKAYRAAKPRQAPQDFVPRKKPEPLGPAARELQELADEMGRAENISSDRAKGRIMASPSHQDLVRRLLREEREATADVRRQRWALPEAV